MRACVRVYARRSEGKKEVGRYGMWLVNPRISAGGTQEFFHGLFDSAQDCTWLDVAIAVWVGR